MQSEPWNVGSSKRRSTSVVYNNDANALCRLELLRLKRHGMTTSWHGINQNYSNARLLCRGVTCTMVCAGRRCCTVRDWIARSCADSTRVRPSHVHHSTTSWSPQIPIIESEWGMEIIRAQLMLVTTGESGSIGMSPDCATALPTRFKQIGFHLVELEWNEMSSFKRNAVWHSTERINFFEESHSLDNGRTTVQQLDDCWATVGRQSNDSRTAVLFNYVHAWYPCWYSKLQNIKSLVGVFSKMDETCAKMIITIQGRKIKNYTIPINYRHYSKDRNRFRTKSKVFLFSTIEWWQSIWCFPEILLLIPTYLEQKSDLGGAVDSWD